MAALAGAGTGACPYKEKMRLTINEIVQATGGELVQGSANDTMIGVSTDTRTLKKGDVFFALQGERDGHTYLADAFAKGAVGAVVTEASLTQAKEVVGKNVIRVGDTLKALGNLAAYWRRRFPVPVVAITGSNGKTTTKEMVARVLSKKYRVLKTEGNFNNLIGLPLTLFRLHKKIERVVLEMGMNAPGEIARLAEIADPTVGVITNIGRAHLHGLGTLEGVARAKGELLERLRPEGLALVNQQALPFASGLAARSRAPVRTFGLRQGRSAQGDILATDIRPRGETGQSFSVRLRNKGHVFRLGVAGRHNVSNALVAIAVGDYYGVSLKGMRAALASFRMPAGRQKMIRAGGVLLIDDTYNANPDSMHASLALLAGLRRPAGRGRTIAILGDMLELGDVSEAAHREVGQAVAHLGIDVLVAVGKQAAQMLSGAKGVSQALEFSSVDLLEKGWPLRLVRGDRVLIKGSHGMRMAQTVDFIKKILSRKGVA